MVWPVIAAAVIGAAGSAYAANKQAKAAEEASENSGAPWEGLQPYLTGNDPVPPWVTQSPWMGQDFQDWNQGAAMGAEDSWLNPPPNLFQGGNPYDPVNYAQQQSVSAPPQQAQQQSAPAHYMGTDIMGQPSFMDNQQYMDYWTNPNFQGHEGGGI